MDHDHFMLIIFYNKLRLYVQEILDSGFERERIIEINVIWTWQRRTIRISNDHQKTQTNAFNTGQWSFDTE